MRMVVRAFALLLLIGTAGVWFALGGTLGWTKTTVDEMKVDPVTEIEYAVRHDQFVPGIEFLALGVAGAVILFAATLFVRITPKD